MHTHDNMGDDTWRPNPRRLEQARALHGAWTAQRASEVAAARQYKEDMDAIFGGEVGPVPQDKDDDSDFCDDEVGAGKTSGDDMILASQSSKSSVHTRASCEWMAGSAGSDDSAVGAGMDMHDMADELCREDSGGGGGGGGGSHIAHSRAFRMLVALPCPHLTGAALLRELVVRRGSFGAGKQVLCALLELDKTFSPDVFSAKVIRKSVQAFGPRAEEWWRWAAKEHLHMGALISQRLQRATK